MGCWPFSWHWAVGLTGYHVVTGAWIVDPFRGSPSAEGAHYSGGLEPCPWRAGLWARNGRERLLHQRALLPARRRFSGLPFCADRQHSGISCGFPDVESSLSCARQRGTCCSGCPPISVSVARCCFIWQRSVFLLAAVRRRAASSPAQGPGNSSRIHSPEDSLQPLACMGRRADCRSSGCCRSVADRASGCDIRVVARWRDFWVTILRCFPRGWRGLTQFVVARRVRGKVCSREAFFLYAPSFLVRWGLHSWRASLNSNCLRPPGAFLALSGGVFLGWGAMVSFGCTDRHVAFGDSRLIAFGLALRSGSARWDSPWLARAEEIPQKEQTVSLTNPVVERSCG